MSSPHVAANPNLEEFGKAVVSMIGAQAWGALNNLMGRLWGTSEMEVVEWKTEP